MASNRRNRERKPARRASTREPRRRFLVVCEGVITEPQYIRGFKAWCRNPLVDVEIGGEHGVPRTLVEYAKKRKKAAEKDAGRGGDVNLRYDEVWCVYDVDEHPGHGDALQMARDNGIELAISNPCFELWILLHFRESPGMQHRHDVQRMVREHLPGYGKHLDFAALQAGYEAAVTRARRLDGDAAEMKEVGRNPTTGVYRLTGSIRGGGRSG